jgi:threonine synthase
MAKVKGLKCRECGKEYPAEPIHVCEFCFGPLEVVYDYEEIKKNISREKIERRTKESLEIHRPFARGGTKGRAYRRIHTFEEG